MRRRHPPFRGRWALPGGFVDAGETTESAAERELFEETGLTGQATDVVGVYSDPNRDPRGPAVSVAYRMRGAGGTPRGGDDAREARWFPLEKLPPLAFDHAAMVEDALARFIPPGARRRPRS